MNETRAVGFAGLAHLAILVALSVSFTRMQPPAVPAPDAIVVDLSEIADVPKATGEPATPAPAEKLAPVAATQAPPPPVTPPTPEPLEAPSTPPPAPPQVAEVQKPEPKPAEPVSKSDIADRFEALPDAARPKVKPAPPAPKPAPKKLADILQNALGPDTPVVKTAPVPASPALPKGAPSPARAELDARAAATLAQAIRSQIIPCWNPPSGSAGVMTVTLRLRLDRKGAVVGLPEVTGGSGSAPDAARRAFDESARRAVLRCAPLELPSDLYNLWADIELNFDPRDIAA